MQSVGRKLSGILRAVVFRPGRFALLILLCVGSLARGNINLEFRPAVFTVAPNANVNVGLYLVSDNATTQYSIAADIVFGWTNSRLQFLGIDNTGGAAVLSSALPNDGNLNEVNPPQDGNGFYQMLGNFGSPVPATPSGTLLTTFRFKALSTSCTGASVSVLPSGGAPVRVTKVLDGIIPNNNITGTFGSSIVYIDGVAPIIDSCAPPQIVPAGPTCQAFMPDLTGLISVTDNCAGNLQITQTPMVGSLLTPGPHAVTIQVRDPGNNTASCNTSVNVMDQTPPTLVDCPTNITVNTNAGACTAVVSWTPPTAEDNCEGLTVVRTQGPPPGSVFAGGSTTTIEYTATDSASLTSVCSFTVTVTPSPDMDNDSDVDLDDLPIFVSVLLGLDTTPVRVARADVNCDGLVDGRDVQPFTDILAP